MSSCKWCGQEVFLRSKISAAGWFFIVIGLVGSPFCIGIPFFILGLFLKDKFVACDKCGRQ